MDFILNYIDFVLHIDRHLDVLIQTYGTWVYLILFAIIFCETGLVVTPFLPGDSLLFVTGTIAARGSLDLQTTLILLVSAAIIGDNVNYWIGRFVGQKIVERKWVKQEYLDRTHHFYEKYGGKTIFIGKFLPIIRTFAPFVAGIAKMTYPKFLAFNISGAITWMCVFILGGYYVGNLPFVKKNFTMVILAIIVLSVLPSVVELIRARRQAKRGSSGALDGFGNAGAFEPKETGPMDLLTAIILGIIEGVTEFLPISSTGHMILASDLMGLEHTEFLKSFEIAIQVGAISSVVFLYWRLLLVDFEVIKRVIVAFIPTGVLGLTLYRVVKSYLLGSTAVVLWSLFLGGLFLIAFEYWHREKEDAAERNPPDVIQDRPHHRPFPVHCHGPGGVPLGVHHHRRADPGAEEERPSWSSPFCLPYRPCWPQRFTT